MKSNFYGNRKSLLAVFICAAFLSGSHVAYAVNESLLVSAYQQPSKIKGTVIDANGEVVIGASVVVKGTANGTITDIDGNFILSDAVEFHHYHLYAAKETNEFHRIDGKEGNILYSLDKAK